MSIDEYMNQNLKSPTFFFHGSPRLFETAEKRLSNDSNGNVINIDDAVFVTSSLIVVSAYAFKDKIKENSQGLPWNFDVHHDVTLPIMSMENVNIDESIFGYIYVFRNDGSFKNEPIGTLQYKSYKDIKPIDVLKINYRDFMQYYEVKDTSKIKK